MHVKQMSPLEIHPLEIKDCPQAAQLHEKGFHKSWSSFEINDLLSKTSTFGLKIQDKKDMLGFILWREIIDESEILTLTTQPTHLRQGLASLLLKAFFKTLIEKKIRTIYLEVAEDNKGAISLYQSHGFKYINQRPNYYLRSNGQRCTALVFVKKL